MNETRLVITGGHLTPALSVIHAIGRLRPQWKLLFIGRRKAMQEDVTDSEEYRVITALGIPFFSVSAGRLHRTIRLRTLVSLVLIPLGFVQSFVWLKRQKPTCVLSFGGYVALPVVLSAYMCGIPVFTHEQTHVLGLANRIICLLSKKIFISWPDTKGIGDKTNVIYTGLPLREQLLKQVDQTHTGLPASRQPIVYITGGVTGARSMNELVYQAVPRLVTRYVVVHQVGRKWVDEARRVRSNLPPRKQAHYIPVGYLDTRDHAYMMQKARLIMGRSGANTVGEVALLGKVAIFIPLPWSGGNEQYANAMALVRVGSATIIDQQNATSETILEQISKAQKDWETRHQLADLYARTFPHDAADRIVGEIAGAIS